MLIMHVVFFEYIYRYPFCVHQTFNSMYALTCHFLFSNIGTFTFELYILKDILDIAISKHTGFIAYYCLA